MMVIIVAVIAIVVIAVLAVMMMGGGGTTIQITNWSSDISDTLGVTISGQVTFSVDLKNTGATTSTGIVTCKVVLPLNQGTITKTQAVTLTAGDSQTITVIVKAQNLGQTSVLSLGTPYCTIA